MEIGPEHITLPCFNNKSRPFELGEFLHFDFGSRVIGCAVGDEVGDLLAFTGYLVLETQNAIITYRKRPRTHSQSLWEPSKQRKALPGILTNHHSFRELERLGSVIGDRLPNRLRRAGSGSHVGFLTLTQYCAA